MSIYHCPECRNADSIDVVAKVSVRLIQDDPDNIQTEPSTTNGDTEWDDNSAACCVDCQWTGFVYDLTNAT